MSRPIPSRQAIAKANEALLKKCDLDADEAPEHCWACHGKQKKLQRAHVVASSVGGGDEPENFFLLCDECHREQPDLASRQAQESWLFSRESHMERLLRELVPVAKFLEANGASTADRVDLKPPPALPAGIGGPHRGNRRSNALWLAAEDWVRNRGE